MSWSSLATCMAPSSSLSPSSQIERVGGGGGGVLRIPPCFVSLFIYPIFGALRRCSPCIWYEEGLDLLGIVLEFCFPLDGLRGCVMHSLWSSRPNCIQKVSHSKSSILHGQAYEEHIHTVCLTAHPNLENRLGMEQIRMNGVWLTGI